jgi:hypothetical protein
MQPRRSQPAITIRSQKAVDRLKLLTRGGRSQTSVIEEALERLPDPAVAEDAEKERRAEFMRLIVDIQAGVARHPFRFVSMAEFDAHEYDERGNLR